MKHKADIGIFISYSKSSKGFGIYNRRCRKIMETIHVKFDELMALASKHNCLEPETNRFNNDNSSADFTSIPSKEDMDNLFGLMLVMIRSRLIIDLKVCMYALTVSTIEPKNIKEAMLDHKWIESMQDELHQFQRLDVWELIPRPTDRNIHQSPRGIFISQLQYTLELLKKHGMDGCDSISTPMATAKLDADLQGTPTDQTRYHSMIGGLMYLTASRPDIAFATFVFARYQARPMVKHLKEVKRIFWYLRQTYNMGLWYPKGSGFELIAYSDVDHAGCHDDCKNIPRRLHEHYHRVENDEVVKSILNFGKNKEGAGMKIHEWMLTREIKLTDHYQMYATVFRVYVPTTQSQPIESTQGTHRTPRTPRTPNHVTTEK
ncbi:ribonuclease H-like domain-containing protein [Tanacetum coccineum]